jgi:hypothetical protein
LRQRYDFNDPAYEATPLQAPVRIELGRLAAKLEQGRVVPISGSGLSAGPPSRLPSGVALGVRLRHWAESKGLGPQIAALPNPDDLGEVAELVEAELGRDVLIGELLAMVPWRRKPFNLAHLAIALMFAEGWITVGFTANWDSLVLAAADTVETTDLPCPCNVATLQTSRPPMHVHVHGRADTPDTLVATTSDLSRPQALDWTEPQLRGALTMGEPMLVGFAVEPGYIVETLEQMLDVMGVAPAAVISLDDQAEFVAKSPRLAAAAQITDTNGPYVAGSATEVLGDVVRHRYAERLSGVLDESERRANGAVASPAVVTSTGVQRVRRALLDAPLAQFLALIWRAAVLATGDSDARQPTLNATEQDLADALAVLMILCSCHDVTDLAAHGEGIRISFSGGSVDTWIALPRDKSQVTTVVTASSTASAHFTRPGDDAIPLLLICARTFGRPPPGGPIGLLTRGPAAGPRGRLTTHRRDPTDVLTLDEIDDRCRSVGGSTPPSLTDLVRL